MERTKETIVQLATATGGGVAIVRLSGAQAHTLGRALIGHATAPAERRMVQAQAKDAVGEVLDAGLYVEFAGPRSFTGEDVAEFHGHGGVVGMGRVVERCVTLGAQAAEAGEFTLRAFLNGKIDLAQAEAVAEAVSAKSEAAQRLAQRQLRGELSQKIEAIRAPLVEAASAMAADIDFPDENLVPLDPAALRGLATAAIAAIDGLLAGHSAGRRVRDGATVAIVGPPNAGKSSVLNALAGFERAIVSPMAGTTRDTIEATVVLEGIAVRLIDTAGLRATADVIEAAGMARARAAAADSDVVLLVVSDDSNWQEVAEPVRALWALNKSDCGVAGAELEAQLQARDGLRISARTGAGFDALRAALAARLLGDAAAETLVTLERHASLLREARAALIRAKTALADGVECAAVEFGAAVQRLGEVLGENVSAQVLGEIFKRFCIGK